MPSYGQSSSGGDNGKIAIKSNLLQLGIGVSNLGAEISFGDRFSVDLPITYSPYTISNDWNFRIFALQPEFRYWFSEAMSRHFVGFHSHLAYFNVAFNENKRYQSSAGRPTWGFGISYGYALKLCEKMNLEFNIGAGYANIDYDLYRNVTNASRYAYDKKDYWGITRVGITLSYMFNY